MAGGGGSFRDRARSLGARLAGKRRGGPDAPEAGPRIDEDQKAMLVAACSEFHGLGVEAVRPLSERMRLVRYPSGHRLYEPIDEGRGRPLRVVVQGHVAIIQRRGVHGFKRSIGPGVLFGEEGVVARAGLSVGHDRFGAICADQTWMLELEPATADALFARSEHSTLFNRLREAHRINIVAPEAAVALGAQPALANVRTDHLYALLEGAEYLDDLLTGDAVPGLTAGAIPDGLVLLLRGRLDRGGIDGTGQAIDAPDVLGLDELLEGRPVAHPLRVRGPGVVVVRVLAERFRQLMRAVPDFLRAVERTLDDEALAAFSRHTADDAVVDSILLVGPPQRRLPLGPMAVMLARGIADQLHDRVRVLRLVPPGARPATDAERLGLPFDDLEIARGDDLPGRLGGALARYDAADADVVVVDASRLPPRDGRDPALLAAAAPGLCKASYVFDDPATWMPTELIASRLEVIPVGLLMGPRPELGPLQRLEEAGRQISGGASGGAAAGAAAASLAGTVAPRAGARARGLARRLRSPIASHARDLVEAARPVWPLRTVRVRLEDGLLEQMRRGGPRPLDRIADGARSGFDRWARAATGRRVGLALGGGGAFGYCHLPLIRALHEVGVPIDMVSGASFGSVVGGYYTVLGLDGLETVGRHWYLMALTSPLGIFSMAPVEKALDLDLGDIPLEALEVPFFPVVTDADTATEWDIRRGSVGGGIRASGSLPPFAPTILGDRRYLDGGLVANVPVQVLHDEGADIILASNPIPNPEPRRRKAPLGIPFGSFWRGLQPVDRVNDVLRSSLMITRTAGEAQFRHADVTFMADTRGHSLTSFGQWADIVAQAEASEQLSLAVGKAADLWRESLRHPPRRIAREGARLRITGGLLTFETTGTGRARPTPESSRIVAELAAWLDAHPDVARIEICARADGEPAPGRAQALLEALAAHGVAADRLAIGALPDGPDGVTFRVPDPPLAREELAAMQTRLAESQRRATEARAAEARARREATARTLTLAARDQLTRGDVELGALLAIEAAAIDPGESTDSALRAALERRGRAVADWTLPGGRGTSLTWSADGHWIGAASTDGRAEIRDAVSGEVVLEIRADATDKAITGIAFDPASRRVATIGEDHRLRVHDRATGAAVADHWTDTWMNWGVAWSARGVLAGTAEGPDGVGLWANGTEPLGVLRHPDRVLHAAFNPTGRRLAVAAADGTVTVWVAESLRPWCTMRGGRHPVDLDWAPDGRHLSVPEDGAVVVYDTRTRTPTRTVLAGHSKEIRAVEWHPDGAMLATASADGSTRVWSRDGQMMMVLRGHGSPPTGIAWHPTAHRLVTWSGDASAIVWDVETGAPLAHLTGHTGSIQAAEYAPDGARLATVSEDGHVRVWDPDASGARVWALGHPATSAAWTGDVPVAGDAAGGASLVGGDRVAVGGGATAVVPTDRGWAARAADGSRWCVDGDTVEGPVHPCDGLHVSPDGRRVAARGGRAVSVLDVNARTAEQIAAALHGDVTDIAWRPDGGLVLGVFSAHGQVVVVAPGGTPEILDGAAHRDGVWSVTVSPDGQRIASGANDRTVRILDGEGRPLAVLDRKGAVRAVAFSPDGALIASADTARRVVLAAADGTAPISADLHRDAVVQLAWSPSGDRLASVSDDGTVRIWDRGLGPTAVIESHSDAIADMVWSADGRWLLTASRDGTVRAHPADGAPLMAAVAAPLSRHAMTPTEWARYMGAGVPLRITWPRAGGPA
jgi:WD40 repeat protein/predicted acylesterase/phospholipase RssA/CRP-like cAMP-binding protein